MTKFPTLERARDHELTGAEIGEAFSELERLYHAMTGGSIDLVLINRRWRVMHAYKQWVSFGSSECVETLLTDLERKWVAQIEAERLAEVQ